MLYLLLPQLIQLAQARPHDAMQEEFAVCWEQDIYMYVGPWSRDRYVHLASYR